MTYIADLDPNSSRNVALDEYVDQFDGIMPDWQTREAYGDTILTEADFPVYDASADESRVSNEDWEAMGEALWTDHRI